MKKRKSKNTKKSAFHANMEIMTKARIESMPILDSEKHIRLLDDTDVTGCYVTFNGRFNESFYARSYQAAERRFRYLVSIS